jgi:hypothetical protein
MLDTARQRVDSRDDDRDPPLPDSIDEYVSAVVMRMLIIVS